MKSIEKNLFIYQSLLSEEEESQLHPTMQIDDSISSEALLFRLLLGTVNLKFYNQDSFITQNRNYSKFGGVLENEGDKIQLAVFDWFTDMGQSDLNNYFRVNKRRNENLFSEILSESSHFFYFQNQKNYVCSFLHLYRFLEFTSYCFPIIYASKSLNHFATFDTFKNYFHDQNEGRLKFFRKFIESIFDESRLRAYCSIDTLVGDEILDKNKHRIILNLCKDFDIWDDGYVVRIKYKNLIDFIVNLRNRYFHFFSDRRDNISSLKFDGQLFFESLNEKFKNWMALIYFELLTHSVYKQVFTELK